MNNELIAQYAHFWRVFERLVNDFDDHAWLHTGRKTGIPARLSFHILKAAQYYMEDTSVTAFASGKAFDIDCGTAPEADLPSRQDIIQCIREFARIGEDWLAGMDLAAANEPFPWAGKTRGGVALFTLKHATYHLGELSMLLNESRNGEAEDNYVKAL
jgi:hypothetical protein